MGIKYYHSVPQQIRQVRVITDVNGNLLYVFPDSKFVKNLPRVTVCSVLNGDELRFGYTTCASKDNFVKRIGQRISFARAIKKPYKVVKIDDMKDIHTISDAIIAEIFELETKRLYQ